MPSWPWHWLANSIEFLWNSLFCLRMPVLLTAFLSLAACALVLATGVKSTERFTTHIGSRLPPAELGCVQSGHVQPDEGRRLSVFKCPV